MKPIKSLLNSNALLFKLLNYSRVNVDSDPLNDELEKHPKRKI